MEEVEDIEEEFVPIVIHIISDVHTEHMMSEPPTPPKGREGSFFHKVLVIAGDIGNIILSTYIQYIELAAAKYDSVFIVLGNHEFYLDKTIDETRSKAKTLVKNLNNVHLLDQNIVTKYGVDWIGCTLWSIPAPGVKKAPICDFSMINGMTKPMYRSLHEMDKKWLAEKLADNNVRPRVVITHHIPSTRVVRPEFESNKDNVNMYFYVDCEDLIRQCDVWFCGHTHRPILAEFGNIPLICNPKGYPHEGSEYNAKLHIVIDRKKNVRILGYDNWQVKYD